ncbi:hypothetical protein ACQKPX_21130 [Photobacterium sp. DNB23_23_1]|nr:hypothetical protein [Photobacterium sp. ZSDE20]
MRNTPLSIIRSAVGGTFSIVRFVIGGAMRIMGAYLLAMCVLEVYNNYQNLDIKLLASFTLTGIILVWLAPD